MIGRRGLGVILRVVVSTALGVAAGVLLGWSVPAVRGLASWGASTASMPWTALTLAGAGAAMLVRPPARRRLAVVVAVMAVISLVAPSWVAWVQGQVWPAAMRAPAPGIDVATLLLAAAAWATSSSTAPDGLATGLGAGAGAVAGLSLMGRLVGAGWLTDAGAGADEAGMAWTGAVMILLLTAAVWLLDAQRDGPVVEDGRRHRIVGGVAALLAPIIVVWAIPAPAAPTRVDYATTALLVVATSLVAQLVLVASFHRDALTAVETMLDASPAPVLFLDLPGTIVRANRAVADAFGWPQEQLVGRSVAELLPAALPQVEAVGGPDPVGSAESAWDPVPRRLTATRRDGTTFPAELTLSPVRLRGRAVVAATVRDVTAHERQLRDLSDVQSMFMTAVSHELRTPLTVVMGIAETLAQHGDAVADDQRTDLLERLAAHARRLDVLLGDLLDLDRLQRGVFHAVQSLDVTEIVGDQARRSAADLGLDVRVDLGREIPEVHADPVLLPRVIDNLLVNAAKYAGGPVEVSVRTQEGGVVIVVDDRGPGVRSEMRDLVFEPFRRGDRVNTATPGVGIGLSLVASVAAAANGRAWVQTRDDGANGASFRVFLPASAPTTIILGEADAPAPTARPAAG